eukprot:gene4364-6652_t
MITEKNGIIPWLLDKSKRYTNHKFLRLFVSSAAVTVLILFVLLSWNSKPEITRTSSKQFRFPIDVVITWVDGNDPEWKEGYRNASRALGRCVDLDRAPNSDYVHDELYYNLRGLIKNMPWVRQVFIATQKPQKPSYIEELNTNAPFPIKVVHHDAFIPDKFLPTYESSWIELFLDRIPGLSEHFIYLNDDMFVINPLQPSQFFTTSGKGIVPIQLIDESWFVCTFQHKKHSCHKQHARRLLGKTFMRSRLHITYAMTRSAMVTLRDTLGHETIDFLCNHRVRTDHHMPAAWTVPNAAPDAFKFVYRAPYSFHFYHEMFHLKFFPWQKPRMKRADVVCVNLLNPSTPKSIVELIYGQLRDWLIPPEEQETFVL